MWLNALTVALLAVAGVSRADDSNLPMCDAKNAKGQPTVRETFFDSAVHELQWIGDDNLLVFVVTESGTLYRSTDGGATFLSQMEFLTGIGNGTVSTVYASADPNKVVVVGHEKRVWVSTSRGTAYKAVDVPQVVNTMAPHYDQAFAGYMLFDAFGDGCFNRSSGLPCEASVFVTRDLFETPPTLVASSTRQYGWGAGLLMFVTTFESASMRTSSYDLAIMSADASSPGPYALKTFSPHSVGFVALPNTIYIAARVNSSTQNLILLRSGRRGLDPVRKIEFPTSLAEARYTIVNDDVGAAFINVQHNDDAWGNLYVSTSDAVQSAHIFTLSLERAVRELSGQVQFAKVYGAQGVYIANVREDTGSTGNAENILTVITYDNGGEWRALQAPNVSASGKQFGCLGLQCHLHLHGVRKRRVHGDQFYTRPLFGPLHTKKNTFGMVLASGNVGRALRNDQVGVFLSRDGGSVWTNVMDGSHTYDFADHGALTLLARNNGPTLSMSYSTDLGANWTTCRFVTGDAIVVDNVIADPSAVSEMMLIVGVDSATSRGYAASIDFSSLNQRACDPNDFVHDYEHWKPVIGGDFCELGVARVVKRRRQFADCFNAEAVESITIDQICNCSRADYICDQCYFPTPNDPLTCVMDPECMAGVYPDANDYDRAIGQRPPLDCPPGTRYNVTRGYTRVEETLCVGGLDLGPRGVECPNARVISGDAPGGGSTVLLVLLVVVVVGVLAALIFIWRRRKSAPPSLDYGTLVEDEESLRLDDPASERGGSGGAKSSSSSSSSSSSPSPSAAAATFDFNPRALDK